MRARLLIDALFGHRFLLHVVGGPSEMPTSLTALISRNTHGGERPYQLTWFKRDLKTGTLDPWGHVDMDEAEVDELVTKSQIPQRVEGQLARYIDADELKIGPVVESANNWIGIVYDGSVFAARKEFPWESTHTSSFGWPDGACRYGDRFRIIDSEAIWTYPPAVESKHALETWADRRGISISRHVGNDGSGWVQAEV